MAESSIFLTNKGNLCSPPPSQAGRGRSDTARCPSVRATSRKQVQVLAPPCFLHPLDKSLCLPPVLCSLKMGGFGSKKAFYPFNACKSPGHHCVHSGDDGLCAGCHPRWVLGAIPAGCITKDRHPTAIRSPWGRRGCVPQGGEEISSSRRKQSVVLMSTIDG